MKFQLPTYTAPSRTYIYMYARRQTRKIPRDPRKNNYLYYFLGYGPMVVWTEDGVFP